jgi:lysylphosphatidylglycerol synthetase-like protein (DUF2156 family)
MNERSDLLAWWVVYMALAAVVFFGFHRGIGIALAANAVISILVAMAAGSVGKRQTIVLMMGFLLGPLGALAGLIAAPTASR